jgi:diguanylate cyclase (GGDEF)-like protein
MNMSPIKILLLDDDREDYIIIRQLLSGIRNNRFELEWLPAVSEARQVIAENRHDVYLVDYRLGDRTGHDIIEEAIEGGCRKPMIVLTAHGDYQLDLKSIQIGAADYLPKRELSSNLLERTICHAVKRTQVLEKLFHQATHDELTGLYNRKYILDRLTTMISGARRHGIALTLCLCDIDHFKEVNDNYGHNAGDRVLSIFSEILREELRNEDIPGRYGGDEFCIVFPHASPEQARVSVERIRRNLGNQVFSSESGQEFKVSASFGISTLGEQERDPSELIAQADKALYLAKQEGRNRTAVLSAGPVSA